MHQEDLKKSNALLKWRNEVLIKEIDSLRQLEVSLRNENEFLTGRVGHLEEMIMGCPNPDWSVCATCERYKHALAEVRSFLDRKRRGAA